MIDDDPTRMSEDECIALFNRLFPDGPAGESVLAEIAPDGWAASPLLAAYHPSPEQLHREAVRMTRNLDAMFGKEKSGEAKKPEPTLEEIRAEYRDPPIETDEEVRGLVGKCLWDVFSDNHEVIADDGRVADLGSFRASGGFIADWLNSLRGIAPQTPEEQMADLMAMSKLVEAGKFDQIAEHRNASRPGAYDYMDFYMGSAMLADRADLSPVHRMIFRRLRAAGCDWVYHFPKLGLVDMGPLRDAMREEEGEDHAAYDPSEAFAREQEEADRTAETQRLREELDDAHREAVEKAAQGPPPQIARAYADVYGDLPRGWPPTA